MWLFVLIKLENLLEFYGNCEEKMLEYVDMYMFEGCWLDCLMKRVKFECGCCVLYMFYNNGKWCKNN